MKKLLLIAGCAALAACAQQQDSNAAEDANVAVAEPDANAAANADATLAAAPLDYKETSWEYTEDGKPRFESIDANGNYIVVSGTEHVDHGTAVVKGTKICFTSAMTKEGEDCWQDPKLEIGQSGESVSDKGEKVTVKRVAYRALTMPS